MSQIVGKYKLISIEEAVQYTGLAVTTLYKMVAPRRVPYLKVGSRLKFDVGQLDGWLKQNTVMPMPAKSA